MGDIKVNLLSSQEEINRRAVFLEKLKNSPIPDNEILDNLGLYIKRQALSRTLFMHEIYQQIINVHGVVMEFGVRWGQNLSLFSSFRGIYEPYNYNRKIIGFDTFDGFPNVHEKDGNRVKEGDYRVTDNYEEYLNSVLTYHEAESPLSHIKKFELVKGDASVTIDTYLEQHPETIVALAYFDFDIYTPTKKCLEAIKDRLTKGSIVAFDELNYDLFPGETLALKEVFGLDKYRIRRTPLAPLCSYIIIE
ncbi:crotonobetainyl-CoA--carnitine CoA-transferase [Paenibacillus sp. Soil766]|uniref:TylF/MycF/NovP-related O-methyltransferase n=1 Tax=Paenibacillus sp. Soil766 TaxID=1736404 RepID=UPI00070CC54D|nr:TylF/MycF/NovP-related O-methyltransferase [Paenibacillus sp. Soil766]KRE97945.1 crotonobetainyl-CoA--carnitine CoA-transferase [Paenibacillus sp. Soil766]